MIGHKGFLESKCECWSYVKVNSPVSKRLPSKYHVITWLGVVFQVTLSKIYNQKVIMNILGVRILMLSSSFFAKILETRRFFQVSIRSCKILRKLSCFISLQNFKRATVSRPSVMIMMMWNYFCKMIKMREPLIPVGTIFCYA